MEKNKYNQIVNFHERIKNELTILLFHGVTTSNSNGIENYSGKHIQRSEFLRQIEFVKANCHILSMDEVIDIKTKKEKYPPKAVAITFDDGYENNYTNAAPILNDLKVPATFYISSGMVGTKLMFYTDIIEDCINLTRKKSFVIQLGKQTEFNIDHVEAKISALEAIKKHCKNSSVNEKNHVIRQLVSLSEIEPSDEHSENYKKITWSQIEEMNSNELFTIGGHSLYHDVLANMPFENAKKDIELSIDLLQNHLKEKVRHYSYPEGQENHYNENIIKILKGNGIQCCPSAIEGLNNTDIDLFNLKRIMVGFNNIPFPFT